jgi:hypothetical protein
MLRVVRVGGLIICSHKRNEGVNAQYHGLHQFNIDTAEGRPILWNQGARSNIEAGLEVKTNTNIIEESPEWVHFSITKLEDFSTNNTSKQLQELLLGTVTYFLNRPKETT